MQHRPMRIAVVGVGPGGLYLASLWKGRHPRDEVELFEQSPADATWGFGVVFSDRALEFLREDDPATVDLIAPHMESWRNIAVVHRGSIGSGTRLALEDALALVKSLEAEPTDLVSALAHYENNRRPIVEKLVAASRRSALWYERFAEHMRLTPLELAMSYITRSERIDEDRLRAMSPRFMTLYAGSRVSSRIGRPQREQDNAG